MLNQNVRNILSKIQDISPSIVMTYPILGIKDIDSSIAARIDISKYDSDSFETFGLLNKLPELLSVIKLLDEPEISQNNVQLSLKDKNSAITYYTSDLDLLERNRVDFSIFDRVKATTPVISFVLTDEEMARLRKASGVLRDLENITVKAENGIVTIVLDSDSLGTSFQLSPSTVSITADFEATLSNENFKKLPLGTYNVGVHVNSKGTTVFVFASTSLETFEAIIAKKNK